MRSVASSGRQQVATSHESPIENDLAYWIRRVPWWLVTLNSGDRSLRKDSASE
jgi:hypothetical protein